MFACRSVVPGGLGPRSNYSPAALSLLLHTCIYACLMIIHTMIMLIYYYLLLQPPLGAHKIFSDEFHECCCLPLLSLPLLLPLASTDFHSDLCKLATKSAILFESFPNCHCFFNDRSLLKIVVLTVC